MCCRSFYKLLMDGDGWRFVEISKTVLMIDRNAAAYSSHARAQDLIILELGWHPSTWRLTNLTPLSGLMNLDTLGLSDHHIKDLEPLSGLINLRGLDLSNNLIFDVKPLSGLINLRGLSLSCNGITNIAPLSGLIDLRDLSLASNIIFNAKPLASLVNLRQLDLSHNSILNKSDLDSIKDQCKIWWDICLDWEYTQLPVRGGKPGANLFFCGGRGFYEKDEPSRAGSI
eukprot:SAG11_NODE_262_length_11529_cov_12.277603_2_plen_228_part_00